MKIDTPVFPDDLVDIAPSCVATLAEYAKRINMHDGLVRALGRLCTSVIAGDQLAMRAAVDDAGPVLALAVQP